MFKLKENEENYILTDLLEIHFLEMKKLDEYKENSDAPFGTENKKALEYILSVGKKDGFNVKNVDNYAGHIEFGEGDET